MRPLQLVKLHRRVHADQVVYHGQCLLVRVLVPRLRNSADVNISSPGILFYFVLSRASTLISRHLIRSSFASSCLFSVCICPFKVSSITFRYLGNSIDFSLFNTCSPVSSSIRRSARWSWSSSVSSDRFRGLFFGPIVRSKSSTMGARDQRGGTILRNLVRAITRVAHQISLFIQYGTFYFSFYLEILYTVSFVFIHDSTDSLESSFAT